MNNKTFSKALGHLSHPVTILSIFVLFFNDHFLRVVWPSWFTGKLGDLAWLYFMPFAAAVILSLMLPVSIRDHTKIVGVLSFSLIGGLFVLGNTLPAVNLALMNGLERLISMPVQITRDPTDLIALPACVLGWLVWQRREPKISKTQNIGKAVVLLSAATFLTIANAPMPDHGIDCIRNEDDQIIASSFMGNRFTSQDGGLSWVEIDRSTSRDDYGLICDYTSGGVVVDPDNENVLYRKGKGNSIERSMDAGEHWEAIPDITLATQAEIAFQMSNKSPYFNYEPGPYMAFRDPKTDNLILAMGVEGVAVQAPSGEWHLVPIGKYSLTKLTPGMIPVLLNGEIILALDLALCIFCTLSLVKIRSWFRIVVMVLLWLLWLFIVSMHPALNSGHILAIQSIFMIAAGVIGLILTIDSIFRVYREFSKGMVFQLAWVSIGAPIIFLIPYVLWGINLIPEYSTSQSIGILWVVIVLAVGIWLLIKQGRDQKVESDMQLEEEKPE